MGGLEESTKFSIASGVGTELDRKWRITRPFTFTGPSKTFPAFSKPLWMDQVKKGNKQTQCIAIYLKYMCICINKRIYANVCYFTSWWVDPLPFRLAQASHRGVGFCQGWWEGCYHDIVVDRSLEQCQMRSGWPTGRRFASPYLLLPAGNAEHCAPPSVGRTACDEDAVGPANHAQLLKLMKM